jgi:hypothetical protein
MSAQDKENFIQAKLSELNLGGGASGFNANSVGNQVNPAAIALLLQQQQQQQQQQLQKALAAAAAASTSSGQNINPALLSLLHQQQQQPQPAPFQLPIQKPVQDNNPVKALPNVKTLEEIEAELLNQSNKQKISPPPSTKNQISPQNNGLENMNMQSQLNGNFIYFFVFRFESNNFHFKYLIDPQLKQQLDMLKLLNLVGNNNQAIGGGLPNQTNDNNNLLIQQQKQLIQALLIQQQQQNQNQQQFQSQNMNQQQQQSLMLNNLNQLKPNEQLLLQQQQQQTAARINNMRKFHFSNIS